jgi:hypothetical protein
MIVMHNENGLVLDYNYNYNSITNAITTKNTITVIHKHCAQLLRRALHSLPSGKMASTALPSGHSL